jgi:hypothetical protein
MKTTLIKLLALSGIAILLMPACKKSDTLVTSNGGTAGTLTVNSTTPALTKATVADTKTQIVTFSFTNATYNFTAAVTNTLQIDVPADNWKNPTSVTFAAGVLSQSYNTLDFDNLLLKLGLKGGVAATVNVRLVQAVSNQVAPIYSNVLTLNVTPFYLTSWIYAVGAFQGWNATSPDSLMSATGNGVYTGIINFTAGNNEFLILPAKNFNNKYATNETGAPTATVAYNAPNNLKAPTTAGQYFVTYNQAAGTITFQLANTYSAIGNTVGDAGGYSNDVPLTKFVNDGVTGWTGLVSFTTGNFKIRQNNDWSFSWGTLGTPDGVTLTDNNGANINVAAGNYQVSFGIAASAKGTSAGGSTPPSVTATYKLVKQ